MIKQIQLRGISRTPSDRATADGGCAESLNVHLDLNETAPTLAPKDISSDIYGNLTRYPIVYIHKMLGVTNYIGYIHPGGTTNNGFYAYGSDVSSHSMGSSTLMPYTETLKHITSIGNTLIIFTDAKPYYFLYKEQAYTFLGNQIARPYVEVITQADATDGGTWENRNVEVAAGQLRVASIVDDPNVQLWNAAKDESDVNHPELLATMDNIWEALSLGIKAKREAGLFVAPFFLRYAMRLYDGTYISSSTPILCGAGKVVSSESSDWASAYLGDTYYIGEDYMGYKIVVRLNNVFKVRLKGTVDIANWGDIVKSIDFFVSDPIYTPAMNAGFSSMGEVTSHTFPYSGCNITFNQMESTARETTIKNEVISKGQFYKVMSIDLKDSAGMSRLTGGNMALANSEAVSGDSLYVADTMPYDYRDSIQYIPTADAQNFNSRLLLIGAQELLSPGDAFLNGLTADNTVYLNTASFRYKLVNPVNGSVNYVMGRNRSGGTEFTPGIFSSSNVQQFGDDGYSAYTRSQPFAWLCYPDTRCTEVEFTYRAYGVTATKRIPMEKHPLLECVYAFVGLTTPITNAPGTATSYSSNENRVMPNGCKLMLSEFENPFIFPAGNIITFNDKLIGAATTSVPLPNGEVGAFPLYAFTEGGIRVLVTTAEGIFASEYAHPNMSRHIALPGTIMGLEQAVVFITKKGVMMVSGNQVTELSANMNGAPYILDASLYTPASGTSEAGGILAVRPWRGQGEPLTDAQWLDILSAVNGGETLMQYMENAKVAYDNNGARLLFFNPSKDYQYVYMLQTQTWHKTVSGVLSPTILNSYPDCLIAYTASGTPKVLDFSTILDSASLLSDVNNPVYGIIVTRPFDLGEPDIRKSLNDIRIRGKYNRADVYYILLGSFDGINWQRMTSLRGGSYKMFRMVLLTRLTATERVTWVDVDYDTRFTNRLR